MENQDNYFYARPLENLIFKEIYDLFMEPGKIKNKFYKTYNFIADKAKEVN